MMFGLCEVVCTLLGVKRVKQLDIGEIFQKVVSERLRHLNAVQSTEGAQKAFTQEGFIGFQVLFQREIRELHRVLEHLGTWHRPRCHAYRL